MKTNYKDVQKNKRLSSYAQLRPCVVSNALTGGERVKDIEKKKKSDTTHLNEF